MNQSCFSMKRRSPDEKKSGCRSPIGSPGNHLHSKSTQLLVKLEKQKNMRLNMASPSNLKKEINTSKAFPCRLEKNELEKNAQKLWTRIATPNVDPDRTKDESQREQASSMSQNLDLQILCEKWFHVAISVLNDLIELACIQERIAVFKSRAPSDDDRLLSSMGLFLRLQEIDFGLVAWDEEAQEFGQRGFAAGSDSRARMLGTYNDLRDVATGMFGLLSDIEHAPVRAIYARYHVSEDD